jgi:multidrug efflux system membrane fusion protein
MVEVSEKDIGSLKTGMSGSVKLSDGSSYNGTVNYVASLSDNSTRTFRVELVVPNDSAHILAGLAAQVNLPAEEIKAHRIPPSSLTLSDDGRIGVKIVGILKTINFRPVKILNDGVSGTWVSGLEDEVDIVVVGQGYVNTGQLVTTVDVSEDGSKNTINTDANR